MKFLHSLLTSRDSCPWISLLAHRVRSKYTNRQKQSRPMTPSTEHNNRLAKFLIDPPQSTRKPNTPQPYTLNPDHNQIAEAPHPLQGTKRALSMLHHSSSTKTSVSS